MLSYRHIVPPHFLGTTLNLPCAYRSSGPSRTWSSSMCEGRLAAAPCLHHEIRFETAVCMNVPSKHAICVPANVSCEPLLEIQSNRFRNRKGSSLNREVQDPIPPFSAKCMQRLNPPEVRFKQSMHTRGGVLPIMKIDTWYGIHFAKNSVHYNAELFY